jgi:hypothetical protein
MTMPETKSQRPATYVAPSIRDYGDLVELTATIGGGLSDVPQGSPTGTGCTTPENCFS